MRQIFDRFETREYTLQTIAEKPRTEGIPFGARQVNVSSMHVVLRNRIYSGEFEGKSVLYQGTVEPLISKDAW